MKLPLTMFFSLTGMDLAAHEIFSRMFSSFKKSCLPRELKPQEWNLSLVFRSLTWPLYKSLKFSLAKHLTWEMCFLLALAVAKRVSELLGFSFCVQQSRTFYFVAVTHNHAIHDPRFEEFTIPSLDDFLGDDRDELLQCPIGALRKYLSWMEHYCSEISILFVSTVERKKQVSQNIILLGLDWLSATCMVLLPRSIVKQLGSGYMKSGRL